MKNYSFPAARAGILSHAALYPALEIRDLFKYLYQSAFGCEHMVSSEQAAIRGIAEEAAKVRPESRVKVQPLARKYCRVSLDILHEGMDPQTLGKLFCLSSKQEQDGPACLTELLAIASDLVAEGSLPFASEAFASALSAWREQGYPALHHSDTFRAHYHPAYRVLSADYASLLPLFCAIDRQAKAQSAPLFLAIEGGSASGKSTLGTLLRSIYDCNLLHMDDFFLRPEQRTPERFAQIGGNVDHERFLTEVLQPLRAGEEIGYIRFDCQTQTLLEPIRIAPKPLTIIEGVYSMHPALSNAMDLSVFLDITPAHQRARIEKRNPPFLAKRFFAEWIPLENRYFAETDIKSRCNLCIPIRED